MKVNVQRRQIHEIIYSKGNLMLKDQILQILTFCDELYQKQPEENYRKPIPKNFDCRTRLHF